MRAEALGKYCCIYSCPIHDLTDTADLDGASLNGEAVLVSTDLSYNIRQDLTRTEDDLDIFFKEDMTEMELIRGKAMRKYAHVHVLCSEVPFSQRLDVLETY